MLEWLSWLSFPVGMLMGVVVVKMIEGQGNRWKSDPTTFTRLSWWVCMLKVFGIMGVVGFSWCWLLSYLRSLS
jgi:hypothetical protein